MPKLVDKLPEREKASVSRGKSRVLVFYASSEHGYISDEEFVKVWDKYHKWKKTDPTAEISHDWVSKGD